MIGLECSHPLRELDVLFDEFERGVRDPAAVRLIDVIHEWVAALREDAWADLDAAGLFFALASRLLVLKLRLLLPFPTDEEPPVETPVDPSIIGSLGARLARLEERQQAHALCALDAGLDARRKVLTDAESLAALLQAAGEILKGIAQTPRHEVVGEVMSPQEAHAAVCALLSHGPRSLAQLMGAARGLLEAICYFLALLEIVRVGLCAIRVEGDEVWLVPSQSSEGAV